MAAVAGPIPQTSSTGKVRSTAVRVSSADRSHTPPKAGFLFAAALPSLANVLVGPIPTQVGMPVQRETVARMSRAMARRSRAPKPARPRNVSSML